MATPTPTILIRPRGIDGGIRFWWTASDPGLVDYYILSDGTYTSAQIPVTTTFYEMTGLTNLTSYTFELVAYKDAVASEPAVFRTIKPGLKPPAPLSAVAYSSGLTEATIQWTPDPTIPQPAKTQPTGWYVVKAESSTDTVFHHIGQYNYLSTVTMSNLNPADAYAFRAYAINDAGYSPGTLTNTIDFPPIATSDLLVYLSAESYKGGNVWYDRSGNGYHAVNDPTSAYPYMHLNAAGNGLELLGGINGNSFRFPPTGSTGIGELETWTLSVWFKSTGGSGLGPCIVTQSETTVPDGNGPVNMKIYANSGTSNDQIYTGGFVVSPGGNGGYRIGSSYAFHRDDWRNMAVTYDRAQIKTYIDGELLGSSNVTTDSRTTNNFYVIGRQPDQGPYVRGELGQVLIYGRALSDGEVLGNFTAYKPYYPSLIQSVTLTQPAVSSTSLRANWNVTPDNDVYVRFYLRVGGSPIPANDTLLEGPVLVTNILNQFLNSTTITPTYGAYYYCAVSLVEGTVGTLSAALQMPYPALSAPVLKTLVASSSNLQTWWTVTAPQSARLRYYEDDVPLSTLTVSSGLSTNTIAYTPLPEKLYYMDISGQYASQILSTATQTMPSPVLTSVILDVLDANSSALPAFWNVSPASAVTVAYYSNTSDSNTGGTLLATHSVAKGTLSDSYTTSVTIGMYYYITVTAFATTVTTLTRVVPAPVVSAVSLSTLSPTDTTLASSWSISPSYSTIIQYFATTSAGSSGGSQVGLTQSTGSGVTTNVLTPSVAPVIGTYYYPKVTYNGGATYVSSATAKLMPNYVSTVTMSTLVAGATTLNAKWTANANSETSVQFYVTSTLSGYATASTLAVAQTVASGTSTLTLTPPLALYPTQYYYASVTPNIGGAPLVSSATILMPITFPDPPTGVAGTPDNTSVLVSWSIPLSNGGSVITSYTVTATGGVSPLTQTVSGAAVSSYTFTGLVNGTAYTFTVYATNAVGNSVTSTASAAVTPAAAAAAPTSLVATHGNTSASIAFTAGATNGGTITNYKVSLDGGATFSALSPAQVTSPVSITGLTNGTTYSVALLAVTQVGDGAASSTVSVTPSTVPGAPTGVSGTHGNTIVALTWSAPSSTGGAAIDHYTAAYSSDGTNYTVFGSTFSGTGGTVTGLTNGVAYTFKVLAHNLNGDSAYSTPSATVTPSTVPGAPTGVAGTHGDTSVALTWSAPSNTGGAAIDYYIVQYSSDGTNYSVFGSTFPNTNGIVTGLTNGVAYTFRVLSHNLNGPSSPSAPSAAVTPSTVPGAPTDVAGTAGLNEISVAWIAPSNTGGAAITSYSVKYSSSLTNYTTFGTTFSSSPGVVTGLAGSVDYTFKAFATNANGNSADSAASSAVAPRMVWNLAGDNVGITNSGLGLIQYSGRQNSGLASRLIASGQKVMYSVQITAESTDTNHGGVVVGWGTHDMNYGQAGLDFFGRYPGNDVYSIGAAGDGTFYYNGTAQSTGLPTYGISGDIIDVAIHEGVGWWVRVNGGSWNNTSANPATDTGGLSVEGLAGLYPAACPFGFSVVGSLLLLETPTYTVPSGYTFE